MILSGIVIAVKPEPLKANSPILVTLSGIVSEVKAQFSKAFLPILVTSFSIVTFKILLLYVFQGISDDFSQSVIAPSPLIVSMPSLSRVHVRLSP